MRPRDLGELLLLAALWGASYLFMRIAAPAFGAVPLIFLRVALAALCLLPLLVWRGQVGVLRERLVPVAWVGLLNSALPFVLIAWATLSVTAGFAAIVNASTPIFTAVIAWLWLGEALGRSRQLGLALGLAGVAVLSAPQADFRPGGSGWAVLALLAAACSYGLAANLTRQRLSGLPPLVAAAGSQLASALLLAPFAIWLWPAQTPPALAWWTTLGLALGCTALAYLLYFRLLGRLGPARAVSVTFLIPVFGNLWGWLFLGEALTPAMLLGGAVILLGTALALGWRAPRPAVPAGSQAVPGPVETPPRR